MRNDALRINDMLRAIKAIDDFVKDLDFEQLENDFLRKSAVMAQLTILGEAAKAIEEETRNQFPDIEWHKISAMRNFLIHEYFGVEWKIVWDTIKLDLPKLKQQLQSVGDTIAR